MSNALIFIAAFCIMEFFAWFTHKYVMHGFLWSLHRDHHLKSELYTSPFEKNDFFFVIFALPAIILIVTGFAFQIYSLVWAGAGVTLYGFTYFTIHEVMIHNRFNLRLKVRGRYFEALVKAHMAHHAPKSKDEFKSFGLLLFPARFLRKE